jgi:hypothetical protein
MDKAQQHNNRWSALKQERSSWLAHWEDISKHLLPRSGRYLLTDRNRGEKKHNLILDNTGTKALRILAAGMMSGMTSPSRPWFKLSVVDPDLAKYQPVKIWLGEVTTRVQDAMARSNVYRALHSLYEELGAFGTASAFVANDFENIIHLHTFTVGEYAIATNFKGEVDTLYREFEVTVGALVKEFGLASCSVDVQSCYQRGEYDKWVTVCHAIEPRTERDTSKRDAINMPWKSCYWEAGKTNSVLRDSGFKSYPCVSPRWLTSGGDIYGSSPAMDALGDIMQLQSEQRSKGKAIEYQSDPPIQVPSSMQNREVDFLPGGVTFYDPISGPQGIRTAFDVPLDIRNLGLDIQDIRGRIHGAFFSDVFTMISQQDGRMTATEVMERHEEKMLMLGPVVERLNNELLDPLVETVFERLLSAGALPPPPEELQGTDLNIEYVSILAQAQKMAVVNSVDRLVGSIGQISAIKPEALDRFDADYYVEMMADKLGVDPKLIVSAENAALVRQQRAQQMQIAQQQAAIQQSAEMAAKVGALPTQPGTMAGDFIEGQFRRA